MKQLGGFSDETIIQVKMTETLQSGEFRLKRTYSAPASLAYVPISFTGDGFVKHEITARLLTTDVERVKRGKGPRTAIIEENYKFAFQGVEVLDGHRAYAFAVKPRRKEAGLFKGKIFVDPQSGRLVRTTGRFVRSPSWWVKRVDFVQDYSQIGEFTMPMHVQATTKVRMIGGVVINIWHNAYEVHSISND